MTRDEAIQKAIKLLRLAKSDNPHEAALAAQRAQEIMDRYEVNQFMLDDDNEEPVEPIKDFSENGEYLDRCKGKQLATWKNYLSAVVANANGCKTFIRWEWVVYPSALERGKYVATLHIVGRTSDAQKVRYIYAFLVKEVNRLVERDGKKRGKTWRNNFRLGVVDTIKKALKEGQQHLATELKKENSGNPMALVKLNNALVRLADREKEVAEWMKDNLDMRKGHQVNYTSDAYARQAGQRAGKEIDLQRDDKALNPAKKMISGN